MKDDRDMNDVAYADELHRQARRKREIEREQQELRSEVVTAKLEGAGRGVELKTEGWGTWWHDWPESFELPSEGEQFRVYQDGQWKVGVTTLEGAVISWTTREERDIEHRVGVLNSELDKIDAFKEKRSELDAAYDALDRILQIRIDKFRIAGGTKWRWDFEPYEMSTATDAMKVAEHYAGQDIEVDPKVLWDRMKPLNPEDVGGFGGHSGNSWDFAKLLGNYLLTDPLRVVAEHGAMTLLTGCEEYSCPHPWPTEVEQELDEYMPGWREEIG